MIIQATTFLCALQILTEKCKCISFIDLPSDSDDPDYINHAETPEELEPSSMLKFDPLNPPAIKGKYRFMPVYKSHTELPEKPKTTVGPMINFAPLNPPATKDEHVFMPDSKSRTQLPEELKTPSEPMRQLEPLNPSPIKDERRYMSDTHKEFPDLFPKRDILVDDGDKFLKQKISALIGQTVHDTTARVKSVQRIKERTRELAPYKAGFILSMVRKSRLMLNDLFNLAVKHRDNWKALQQLKVFEYIVHTNVDTTNLVRQLVEIHINHLNSTNMADKRRVVLL